ncbi:MAG: type II toxin-antitoxin system RelE/ParE family toxin [Methylococcaceae bacterium]|nr:type II toxin-antitoxin system RelE/ParE family toxin [Methylococcaceae bacterium]
MNYEIQTTITFDKWFSKIKDKSTKYRLEARLSRLSKGNFGDATPVASSLFELRFFFGSGFRIYYTLLDNKIVLLLCGGDKSSQSTDIEQAKILLTELNKRQKNDT